MVLASSSVWSTVHLTGMLSVLYPSSSFIFAESSSCYTGLALGICACIGSSVSSITTLLFLAAIDFYLVKPLKSVTSGSSSSSSSARVVFDVFPLVDLLTGGVDYFTFTSLPLLILRSVPLAADSPSTSTFLISVVSSVLTYVGVGLVLDLVFGVLFAWS